MACRWLKIGLGTRHKWTRPRRDVGLSQDVKTKTKTTMLEDCTDTQRYNQMTALNNRTSVCQVSISAACDLMTLKQRHTLHSTLQFMPSMDLHRSCSELYFFCDTFYVWHILQPSVHICVIGTCPINSKLVLERNISAHDNNKCVTEN